MEKSPKHLGLGFANGTLAIHDFRHYAFRTHQGHQISLP